MIRSAGWIIAIVILPLCAGENASARDAPGQRAPDQWKTSFDKRSGHVTAAFQTIAGASFSLSCDSAGARPGRGAITLTVPVQQHPDPLPPHTALIIEGSGRRLSLPAILKLEEAPPSQATKTAARKMLPQPLSLTATFLLNGEEKSAAVMADLVTLIQAEKKAATLRLSALQQDIIIGTANPQRALSGFEQGCQNYLPPADEEVIWDWHQGLDQIDGQRSITLVAQANPADTDGARLTLHCHAGHLRMSLHGLRGISDTAQTLFLKGDLGSGVELTAQQGKTRADIEIAKTDIQPVLDLLRTQETMTISSRSGEKIASFPVAGFRLASRLSAEHCPSINP